MAKKNRYCGMCDEWTSKRECPACGADTDTVESMRRSIEGKRKD